MGATQMDESLKSVQRALFYHGLHTLFVKVKRFLDKNTIFICNYNLIPIDMYNGLSEAYCIKPVGKSISMQRVKSGKV